MYFAKHNLKTATVLFAAMMLSSPLFAAGLDHNERAAEAAIVGTFDAPPSVDAGPATLVHNEAAARDAIVSTIEGPTAADDGRATLAHNEAAAQEAIVATNAPTSDRVAATPARGASSSPAAR